MLEQRAKEHRELKMKRRQEKLEERRQRQLQREKEQEEERKKREEKKRLHNLSMPIIGLLLPWAECVLEPWGTNNTNRKYF